MLKYILVLICLIALAQANVKKVEGIAALNVGASVKGYFSAMGDNIIFRTDVAATSVNNKQDYFLQYALQADHDVCMYVRYGLPPTISPQRYLDSRCTNATHKQLTFAVETHLFQSGAWFASVFAQTSQETSFTISAFNNTQNVNIPGTHACPIRASAWAAAGPYSWKGYCWYLGNIGQNCDTVCKGLGGSNLADFAQHKFDQQCTRSCNKNSDEPIIHFYNNGNPHRWTMIQSSVEHNLGYGILDSRVDCHCLTGPTVQSRGSFPGQQNNFHSQSLACPCFANKT